MLSDSEGMDAKVDSRLVAGTAFCLRPSNLMKLGGLLNLRFEMERVRMRLSLGRGPEVCSSSGCGVAFRPLRRFTCGIRVRNVVTIFREFASRG